jgi:hypothetical protein
MRVLLERTNDMWTFDGETWSNEDASPTEVKRPNEATPHFDMFYPELQVIEIVPLPQTNYVPPLPRP